MSRLFVGSLLPLLLLLGLPSRAEPDPLAEGQTPAPRLRMEQLVVGLFQTNCYILWEEVSGCGLVIDPGADTSKILARLEANHIRLTGIVQTHNHVDHAFEAGKLQHKTGAPLYRHPLQDEMAKHPFIGVDQSKLTRIDLLPPATLALGSLSLPVLHTPGHEPGSLTLVTELGIFSGDLLFKGSIGRTDFPGGDRPTLIRAIKETLAFLPDETPVFPGHMEETTLGTERQNNPFLKPTETGDPGDRP